MIGWERLFAGKCAKDCYRHKPESVLENRTIKILWDLEIQTDSQILSRRAELELINKKERTCHLVNFAVPVYHRKRINTKTETLNRELKKLWI